MRTLLRVSRRLISFKKFFLLLSLFMVFPLAQVFSAPLSIEQIPETLRPWVDWVLKGHETETCPFLNSQSDSRKCVWPGELELSLDDKGGSFTQSYKVYADSWAPLPGDTNHWPLEVKSDGQSAAVIEHEDFPSVYLKKGAHTLTGRFEWERSPESFPLPTQIGLVSLRLKGQVVDFPKRDDEGRLWLQTEQQGDESENSLEIRVHRYLDDSIPFQMTTRLTLNIGGKNREVVLGKPLLKDFIPMDLKSTLPARLDPDGRLRVQLRPGTWQIDIMSRHVGPVSELTLEKSEDPWAPDEVWVFQAHNDLRLAVPEGVPTIDPQQTTLPDEWKQLPAYRIQPGDTLRLVEKRRGDSDPAPDQLSLTRDLWLDFNGGGYTLQDRITGKISRSWRLEMNAPVLLGRVAINNQDQFITRLGDQKRVGVEIRQGQANLSADSRIDGSVFKIPAVGWNEDFQSVSARLHLPPGWRLFSVSGADDVPQTWINQWTLLEIFLVLMSFLIFWKLWGWQWGLIGLATLVLTFPERGSPHWIWLAVLAAHALVRALPKGKFQTVLKVLRAATLLVLLILSVPFLVHQVRVGLFPVLEYPHRNILESGYYAQEDDERFANGTPMAANPAAPPAPQAEVTRKAEEPPTIDKGLANAPSGGEGLGAMDGSAGRKEKMVARMYKTPSVSQNALNQAQQINLLERRPGTKVQTGPGLPRWHWNEVSLNWSGPVEKTQDLRLFLIPPWMNLIFSVLRVLLLALLILCVLGFPGQFWPEGIRRRFHAPLFAGLVGVFFLLIAGQARADFPPENLLNQLRDNLLEQPECAPDCADISQMALEVQGDTLRARLEVSSQAGAAIPIPGNPREWSPQKVVVDGQNFSGILLDDDKSLYLELSPGAHQVILEGKLPEKETVQIALPLKPHHITSHLSGWSLEGISEEGEVESNLQLTRTTPRSESNKSGEPTAENFPPLLQVERHLQIGLTWEVDTTVRRLTPANSAVLVNLPLLPGESVTSPGFRTNEGKIQINMAPQATEVTWHSVLQDTRSIALKATEDNSISETWLLEVNPIWHVEFQGIPFVHQQGANDQWLPQWQPWPGEALTVNIQPLEGIPGQTLTADRASLAVNPGVRYTDVTLDLELRSSLGGQHSFILPEGAQLQALSINGASQALRQDQRKVTIPIVPGAQTVQLQWQQSGGIATFYRTPTLDLGLPSVNTEIKMQLPQNRWLLFAGGLRVGPVILFWSLMVVVVLVSFGLSRVHLTPLSFLQWILLGVGLTQVPVWASAIVAAWFLALGWRKDHPAKTKIWFNLFQIFLIFWAVVTLGILVGAIYQGLLGTPDMQVAGNGSDAWSLLWFQDRSAAILPQTWTLSLPTYAYKLAMLLWALWIAFALLRWIKWGWNCLNTGGAWQAFRKKKVVVVQEEKPIEP